jgi:hypothetical protein
MQMMAAGTGDALAAMRRGVAADLRNVGNTLPQPLQDGELLLAPERASEERRERIRQTLREDGRRWTGGVARGSWRICCGRVGGSIPGTSGMCRGIGTA